MGIVKAMDCIDDGIAQIRQAFDKIQAVVDGQQKRQQQTKIFTRDERMTLHFTVYRLTATCHDRERNAQSLCASYAAAFDAYLSRHVLPSIRTLAAASPLDRSPLFLDLERHWAAHSVKVGHLAPLIEYLDRNHLIRRGFPSLAMTADIRFREVVFDQVKAAAAEAVLKMVEKDRESGRQDYHSAVKIAVGIFVEMGMGDLSCYTDNIETAMVRETGIYYNRKAERWIESDTVPEYMLKAEEAIMSEEERARKLLHPSSEQKVIEEVQNVLLVAHATRLLDNEETGFRALVRADKTDHVKTIFRVYSHFPKQLKKVAELLERHLVEEGLGIVEASVLVIPRLLELHRRYSVVYVRDCFESHELFKKAFSEALAVFTNEKVAGNKLMVELLAEFCEEVLKRGGLAEKMSDKAVEETMESVVKLLVSISDKDIFVEFHRRNLSRRLLRWGQAASLDYDKCLLSKLKGEFGFDYTAHLEGMLKDMAIAKEENVVVVVGDVSLSVTVLRAHNWPISKNDSNNNLVVPAEIASCIEAFTGSCNTKFQSKKLDFHYALGTCDLRCNFETKAIDLVVSPHQAILLMLFNDNDKLAVSEIMKKLNMGDDDYLITLLHSLSCSKYKILNKTPRTDTVAIDDIFEFNAKFDDEMGKIEIPLPSSEKKQEVEEEKKVVEEVEIDRKYCVDAAIVRIMKRTKTINFHDLVNECIEILKPKFNPDIKLIRKRVEHLIEMEFIERDESDNNLIHYVP